MKYIKTYEIFDELMIIPQKTDKNIIVNVGDYVFIHNVNNIGGNLFIFINNNIGIVDKIIKYDSLNDDVLVKYYNIPTNIIGWFTDDCYRCEKENLILATQAEIEEFKIKLKANKYNL